nr:MAG TPA: hypothetical protein [Caudoviricetes sp.]
MADLNVEQWIKGLIEFIRPLHCCFSDKNIIKTSCNCLI